MSGASDDLESSRASLSVGLFRTLSTVSTSSETLWKRDRCTRVDSPNANRRRHRTRVFASGKTRASRVFCPRPVLEYSRGSKKNT